MSFSCCHHRQRGTAAVCSARPSAPHPPCPVLHGTPAHPAQERMAGQTAPQTSLSTAGSTVRGRECNVENQKCTTVTVAPASQIDSRPAEAEESIHFLPPELRLLQPFTGKPEGKEAAEDPVPAPPEPCDRSGPPAPQPRQSRAQPCPRPACPSLPAAASHHLQSDRRVSENQVVLFNA